MQDEAVDADLSVIRVEHPDLDANGLASIYQRDGWTAYWRARIDWLRPYSNQQCVPYDLGVSYLRLGNRDLASLWLNRAVDQRCLRVIWMQVDPLLDDLRNDPRYDKLLRKVNLAGS
jgi:hypothetical protein